MKKGGVSNPSPLANLLGDEMFIPGVNPITPHMTSIETLLAENRVSSNKFTLKTLPWYILNPAHELILSLPEKMFALTVYNILLLKGNLKGGRGDVDPPPPLTSKHNIFIVE